MSQPEVSLNPDQFEPLPREEKLESVSGLPAKSVSFWGDAWRRFKQNRLALSGLWIIVLMIGFAVLGPILVHWNYADIDMVHANNPPSMLHYFGTDQLGRDLFVRVAMGARISIGIGLWTSFISFVIGVTYGSVAAYFGGVVDEVLMRIVDVLYGLPFILYAILLMVVMGSGLINIFIAIGAVYWLGMARIVRGEVLRVKEEEYVLAARTMGVPSWQIILRHLIPNIMGPVIVTMTVLVPDGIFAAAFLSFIGLGVSAPVASWGTLANEGYQNIHSAPWLLLFPALAISITMLAFNFVGDGLRDALDPKQRRG